MEVTEEVMRALENYYRAFSALDLEAVVPYFNEPALFMGPPGVFPVPTAADLRGIVGPVMEDLRRREYAGSELRPQEARVLSATDAMVRGVALRFRTNGEELERVGITYMLHKVDEGWKIAVMVFHDEM